MSAQLLQVNQQLFAVQFRLKWECKIRVSAVALALAHFEPAAAIPGAIFSVTRNLTGSLSCCNLA